MNKYTIYLTIFGLSLFILSLQIVLAILLEVFSFSPIFAISLAFLGLSAGGIFSYIKYSIYYLEYNMIIGDTFCKFYKTLKLPDYLVYNGCNEPLPLDIRICIWALFRNMFIIFY